MWRIKLPYFLEGFIIGLVIFGTISALSLVYIFSSCKQDCQYVGFGFSYVLFFSIIGTIICAIIGWIYGMRKGENSKFYWLKGGFIAFIIQFIFGIIIQFNAPLYRIIDKTGFLGIVSFLFWPLIFLGIIIGWIYGKTKSKN